MSICTRWKSACRVLLLCATATAYSPAQTYTVLFNFNGYNGSGPNSVVQGRDGNFYGTTNANGGPNDQGTVFKVTPAGKMTTLHRFAGTPDGANPRAELVLGSDGNFYGTTDFGGAANSGTVFTIKPGGMLTILHSFSGADGAYPAAALLQTADGNFYGTTSAGGAHGDGTVFKMTSAGALTTLHSFTGADGSQPLGKLVQAANGSFYGTTSMGGANSKGTVFRITADGTLRKLHNFAGADGSFAAAGLVQGSDGDFYGTTGLGAMNNDGTVFKITPGGTLTTLYSFCAVAGCADGSTPQAPLKQASDGNLYGTTIYGGNTGHQGTIFRITPEGALTTLHEAGGPTGIEPRTVLIEGADGNLYGTMAADGSHCCGVVFQLSVGLGAGADSR